MRKIFSFIVFLLFVGSLNLMAVELKTEDPDELALHPMLADVLQKGPYAPKWGSLVQHPLPAWFKDGKVGISIHWGLYSVPGWTPRKDSPYGVAYAEWYWFWMKTTKNKMVLNYHKKNYGKVAYDDFMNGVVNLTTNETEGFFTQDFNAEEWVKLFKQAGAKYIFITSKHHDGYCLWDTKYTDRNSVKSGPKRDLLKELVSAARKHGLKIGFYYSFYEWYNPIYWGKKINSDYKGIKPLQDEDRDGINNEYVDDYMIPQVKELIDLFQPDYLCFDGEWDHGYLYWRSRQLIAYYYNQAAARNQEVVINDRFGQAKEKLSDTRGIYGDFYHVEHYANIDKSLPWSLWRGFGYSYGYNRNEAAENIMTNKQVIQTLTDVVADNGNMEYNIGPMANGIIPQFEIDRLKIMGKWLEVYGESIYQTRKWGQTVNGKPCITWNPEKKRLYFFYDSDTQLESVTIPGLKDPIKKVWIPTAQGDRSLNEFTTDGKITIPKNLEKGNIYVFYIQY